MTSLDLTLNDFKLDGFHLEGGIYSDRFYRRLKRIRRRGVGQYRKLERRLGRIYAEKGNFIQYLQSLKESNPKGYKRLKKLTRIAVKKDYSKRAA